MSHSAGKFRNSWNPNPAPKPGAAHRPAVTPRMLLAHCSGLPAYAPLYKTCATASELLEACLHMPLESVPGAQAVYSDIGFILLGHLLEKIAGERLDGFCRSRNLRASGNELHNVLPSSGASILHSAHLRRGEFSWSSSSGRSS